MVRLKKPDAEVQGSTTGVPGSNGPGQMVRNPVEQRAQGPKIDEGNDRRPKTDKPTADEALVRDKRAAATDAAKARLISRGWNSTWKGSWGLKGLIMSANIENRTMDHQQVAEAQCHLDKLEKDVPEHQRRKAALVYDAFKDKEVKRKKSRYSDSEDEPVQPQRRYQGEASPSPQREPEVSGGQRCGCRCGCRIQFEGLGFVCLDCKQEGPRHSKLLSKKMAASAKAESSKCRRGASRSKSRSRSPKRARSPSPENVPQRWRSHSRSPSARRSPGAKRRRRSRSAQGSYVQKNIQKKRRIRSPSSGWRPLSAVDAAWLESKRKKAADAAATQQQK
eukprot:gnl/MRDRNA2_/MRDRNA2_57375_c0_seq1.p1 gnl/MRDRNA2_/MRDRNA2_57375_c0~~gnl/MRDRNA2_/MRDRNA2_57375_c0_seq1.p1  ORF type:complete len:335 (+),score=56.64 gnl/MRDRNA2_/MRDRNA2_57375_c0_seq1:128-1132(+)